MDCLGYFYLRASKFSLMATSSCSLSYLRSWYTVTAPCNNSTISAPFSTFANEDNLSDTYRYFLDIMYTFPKSDAAILLIILLFRSIIITKLNKIKCRLHPPQQTINSWWARNCATLWLSLKDKMSSKPRLKGHYRKWMKVSECSTFIQHPKANSQRSLGSTGFVKLKVFFNLLEDCLDFSFEKESHKSKLIHKFERDG